MTAVFVLGGLSTSFIPVAHGSTGPDAWPVQPSISSKATPAVYHEARRKVRVCVKQPKQWQTAGATPVYCYWKYV